MLLTDRFVYVHMPKTGGTFVTSALERIHRPNNQQWQHLVRRIQGRLGFRMTEFPNRRYGQLCNVEPKHGTCHDIPETHAHLPIVSCMRSPYEWYVSQYEFSWWKRTNEYDADGPPTPAGWAIEQALPEFISSHRHFPEISFAEFMELCENASDVYNRSMNTRLGLYTHSFIRYYYIDPVQVLKRLSENYILSGAHIQHRFNVSFIHTERLNAGLEATLNGLGYRLSDLEFIKNLGRILPMGIGRTKDQNWEGYYTSYPRARVREADTLLFTMFPSYDI